MAGSKRVCMNPSEKISRLREVYTEFERMAAPWKSNALCRPECSFCCTHFGRVDVITLEALLIHDWIEGLPEENREPLRAAVAANREFKLNGRAAPCPFLDADKTCRICEIRPFSCRQLYSVRPCSGSGPTVHRAAKGVVDAVVRGLQKLDDTGYSGHISFVLELMGMSKFMQVYRSGGFNPQEVAEAGRKYRLAINRMMAGE